MGRWAQHPQVRQPVPGLHRAQTQRVPRAPMCSSAPRRRAHEITTRAGSACAPSCGETTSRIPKAPGHTRVLSIHDVFHDVPQDETAQILGAHRRRGLPVRRRSSWPTRCPDRSDPSRRCTERERLKSHRHRTTRPRGIDGAWNGVGLPMPRDPLAARCRHPPGDGCARSADRFPFPIPNGWFIVAMADDWPPGRRLPLYYFGRGSRAVPRATTARRTSSTPTAPTSAPTWPSAARWRATASAAPSTAGVSKGRERRCDEIPYGARSTASRRRPRVRALSDLSSGAGPSGPGTT